MVQQKGLTMWIMEDVALGLLPGPGVERIYDKALSSTSHNAVKPHMAWLAELTHVGFVLHT